MDTIKLLDSENESDDILNHRIKKSLRENICNILSVILSCIILLVFIISSVDYYFKEKIYIPYNINVDTNNYYITWNTKKKIYCKLFYYIKESKYVSIPEVTYKNVFIYKASIDELNYKTLYDSVIKCTFDNVIYKSRFFNFMLNP